MFLEVDSQPLGTFGSWNCSIRQLNNEDGDETELDRHDPYSNSTSASTPHGVGGIPRTVSEHDEYFSDCRLASEVPQTSPIGTAYLHLALGVESTFTPVSDSISSPQASTENANSALTSHASSIYSSPATHALSPGSPGSGALSECSHSDSFLDAPCRPPKRRRALHDVDGPHTGHLHSKKRRLRLHLITSRLSQPFSLPATHILNRETDEDTPVLSRFVKFAAMSAKKAGHQTSLVRKAAILNRVRLRVRQAAVDRGHERIYKMAGMGVMTHGIQLVTASTGAMFPGRSGEQVPGPIVPRAWRPHTTALSVSHLATPSRSAQAPEPVPAPNSYRPPPAPRLVPVQCPVIEPCAPPPATSIMTPMLCDDDDASFPSPDLDSRYADMSEDDMDDVYADFGVLFGGGSTGSPERVEEDDHFYEEYLDEVDGITWAS
jgi:hypothetical protein